MRADRHTAAATFVEYRVARALHGKHLQLDKGDLFPVQDISWIRLLGPAYGMHDAATCDLADLDYVKVVSRRQYDPRLFPDRAPDVR